MQSPKESSATEIYLTMSFDVSLQSSSLQISYKYPGKQHIKKKILKTLGFLALARVAFDLPEQLLLCRYEKCTLTKGNVCPWIFTDCKFSSAQAKPHWQNVRPYSIFCAVLYNMWGMLISIWKEMWAFIEDPQKCKMEIYIPYQKVQ